MKSLIFAFLVATTIPATVGEAEVPHVVAFGTAVTQVKPDLLRWSVTVSNKGAELSNVSERHHSITEAVLRLLTQKRLRPEETQTSGMRFSENREYRGGNHVKDGYLATTQVSFTLRTLEDYRSVWIDLSRIDGVSVDSVAWDASNRIEVQNSTRLEALRSARTKAEEMAGALGSKIAEPIAIEEVQWESAWAATTMNSISSSPRSDDQTEAIAPGAVPVRAKVRVVFRLVAR